MIPEIQAAEEAIAKAIHAAGLVRGGRPDGEKAEIRYVIKQLKGAQPFVERAKRKAQVT